MLTVRDLTPEQLTKLNKFINTYDESTQKIYSEIFAKLKKAIVDKPYYEAYLNIIKKTAQLMKEMGCSDPMSASIIFEYLLWNGYFSKDRQLVYCDSDRINNLAITGADIMRGKSVCLNNAEMLTRVLDEMGFDATLIGCRIDPHKKPKREYTPPIERKEIKEPQNIFKKLISYPITRAIGNHAVTLITVGKGYYVSDPTTLAFATVYDFQKAKYIGMDLEMEIKPWCMFALNEGDRQLIVETMIKTVLLSDHKPINLEKIKVLYENIPRLLDKEKSVLDDFYDSNRKDIDTVCKTLTRGKY